MNSIMERCGGSCRRELLDRTLVWNQRHLMIVLREYEDFCNTHRPHRALKQAAPLRQLPDGITDLDQFRVRRRDRAGGVIHEYHLVALGFRHPQEVGELFHLIVAGSAAISVQGKPRRRRSGCGPGRRS